MTKKQKKLLEELEELDIATKGFTELTYKELIRNHLHAIELYEAGIRHKDVKVGA